jgi:hypothetical protein
LPYISRRAWLAAASGALLTSCGRRAGSGFNGYALVATAGEESISITDLSNFTPFRQVPLGAAPSLVVPGAGASYVLTPASGTVHALDIALRRAASRKLADELCGLHVAAGTNRLFALAGGACELIAADPHTLVPQKRWRLAAQPVQFAVSASGWIAVSSGTRGILELIAPQSGQTTRRDFEGPIGEVLFRRDGKVLLVANYKDQALTALQVPSLEVIVHLPLAMRPDHLCFNADGGQLFITGREMDGIAIAFPYLPLEIEQTVLAGRDPGAMACSENPAYLLVASASGANVYVLNIDDRKVLGIVEVGQRPGFIAVTPDSQYALVLNEGSGDMAVIRLPVIRERLGNPAVMRGKAAAALFTMLPVGSRPVHAAIVPRPA